MLHSKGFVARTYLLQKTNFLEVLIQPRLPLELRLLRPLLWYFSPPGPWGLTPPCARPNRCRTTLTSFVVDIPWTIFSFKLAC